VLFEGLHAMIGGRPFALQWSAVLVQALVNGLIGVIAFLVVEQRPGMLDRRRMRRAVSQAAVLTMATTTLMPDDRRSLTSGCRCCSTSCACCSRAAVGFWIFQIAQHDKFLEIAENNRTRRLPCRAARRAARSRRQGPGREPEHDEHRASCASRPRTSRVLRTLAAATGADEAAAARRRQSPAPRPELPADRAD
jgi:hypothetical protein